MRIRELVLVLCILGLGAAPVLAKEVTCEGDLGACTVSEYSFNCTCADGSGIAGGGVPDGDAETMVVDEEYCLDILNEVCREFVPLETCESEKGACDIFEDFYDCTCADGSGSGGGESDGDGGPVDPDEPLFSFKRFKQGGWEEMTCDELLVQECPNEPPAPQAVCAEEFYPPCNGMATWYGDCSGETVWPYQIIECCEDFEEYPDDWGEIWDCVQAAQTCEDFYDCFETAGIDGDRGDVAADGDATPGGAESGDEDQQAPGEADGDGDADGDVDEEAAGEDGTTDGTGPEDDDDTCAHTSAPAAFILLGLLAVIGLRRRKA